MSNYDLKWQDEVNGFLFANYDFEYFLAKREVLFDGQFVNYIAFPCAENGRYVSQNILTQVLEELLADDSVATMIFGSYAVEHKNVQLIYSRFNNAYYYIWNNVQQDEYDALTEDSLCILYRY